jgi:hypothetical protein
MSCAEVLLISSTVLHVTLLLLLLQQVRRDVYEAGLLQQLDRLLAAWGQLAEVRRKMAR